ncbi:related to Rgl1p [Zygosaccharomyces bailii]|nr:related to Rgl1p [Zygosaccharomyces bailii]
MTHPVISLKPSYNSVIRGCPGLPDTLPRIECELRVRSNDGKPFRIDKIEVVLKGIESLLGGYHSFGSKSKIERVTVHYKKNIKMSEKKIVGIDIPLTIGLPEEIRETNYNQTFGSATTLLECTVRYNGLEDPQVFAQAVNVEKYTIVPNPTLFPHITKRVHTADRKFIVEYTVLNPCVTVDDHLKLQLEIRPNGKTLAESSTTSLFGKKFTKLKSVSVGLKECLEVLDGTGGNGENKENVLQDVMHIFEERITNNGIKLKLDVPVAARNALFGEFEMALQEPDMVHYLQDASQVSPQAIAHMPSTKLLQNRVHGAHGIPFQYHSSVTTTGGSLFRITHSVAVKIKISSGKSLHISQPVEISAWTQSQLKGLDQLVAHERETAKYARQFYDNFGGISRKTKGGSMAPSIVEYPPLPPVVYPNDRETLRKLDIKYANIGSFSQRIPLIE